MIAGTGFDPIFPLRPTQLLSAKQPRMTSVPDLCPPLDIAAICPVANYAVYTQIFISLSRFTRIPAAEAKVTEQAIEVETHCP